MASPHKVKYLSAYDKFRKAPKEELIKMAEDCFGKEHANPNTNTETAEKHDKELELKKKSLANVFGQRGKISADQMAAKLGKEVNMSGRQFLAWINK